MKTITITPQHEFNSLRRCPKCDSQTIRIKYYPEYIVKDYEGPFVVEMFAYAIGIKNRRTIRLERLRITCEDCGYEIGSEKPKH
jgi:Zn finger protein HypA/HybF involved in hydrogenase expression